MLESTVQKVTNFPVVCYCNFDKVVGRMIILCAIPFRNRLGVLNIFDMGEKVFVIVCYIFQEISSGKSLLFLIPLLTSSNIFFAIIYWLLTLRRRAANILLWFSRIGARTGSMTENGAVMGGTT